MRSCIFILTVLTLVPSTLFSQQTAVSEDGRKVILESDGTWRFESPKQEDGIAKLERPSTFIALSSRALEENDAENALSYAEQALALAAETHGKALFYFGMSAWHAGDIDLSLSTFEECSKLKGTRYATPCGKQFEKLEKATTNGAVDPPPWATVPFRHLDLYGTSQPE